MAARTFEEESSRFLLDVQHRAAELVRAGDCAPWDAVLRAREDVLRERRARRSKADRRDGLDV